MEETGGTFEENAWLKASEYASMSGLMTLADDSGLEVDTLAGEPGIRSARYGGDSCTRDEDRVELLLKNMKDVPWEERGARFRCVIAGATTTPTAGTEPTLITQAEGLMVGMIQYNPQGGNGFGYDPVFYLPEYDQTAAQLSLHMKNQISHRAKAAKMAVEALNNLINDNR